MRIFRCLQEILPQNLPIPLVSTSPKFTPILIMSNNNKLLVAIVIQPIAIISGVSLLLWAKTTKAIPVLHPEVVDRPDPATNSLSAADLKVCTHHPHLAKHVCVKAQALSSFARKPEIDVVSLKQSELETVTDIESDAAVALFGCDCPKSINCLRRLRNNIPEPVAALDRQPVDKQNR